MNNQKLIEAQDNIGRIRKLQAAAKETQRLAARTAAEHFETDLGTMSDVIGTLAGAIGTLAELTADTLQQLAEAHTPMTTDDVMALLAEDEAFEEWLPRLPKPPTISITEAQLADPNFDVLAAVQNGLADSMRAGGAQ